MSLLKSFNPFIGLMLLIVIMSSCKEEELSTTGKLKVTFTNHPGDLAVGISPAENPQLVISDWLNPDSRGILTCNLNYGNYILTSSSSTIFPQVGFQIRAGETTIIFFDSDNAVHVE